MFKQIRREFRKIIPKKAGDSKRMRVQYKADGLGVSGKNIAFLQDERFAPAWAKAVELNQEGWRGAVPDIRWRAYTACWAASHALTLGGDFVECGVHTGLLSLTICEYCDFKKRPQKFWLFDTFAGIPARDLTAAERAKADIINEKVYFDVWDLAQRNFAPYEGCSLVRGMLPDTLAQVSIEKISYLSIDLNNVAAERGVIETLWPKIVQGGFILLDDYGFTGYEAQHDMWDAFAQRVNRSILPLPTGQGLLIR